MADLSKRELKILQSIDDYDDGMTIEQMGNALKNRDKLVYDKLINEKYIECEVLENRGLVDMGAGILNVSIFDCDYGNWKLTDKGQDALAEYDFDENLARTTIFWTRLWAITSTVIATVLGAILLDLLSSK